eukprot:6173558-Pleurochrysis_carterae.AAC.2
MRRRIGPYSCHIGYIRMEIVALLAAEVANKMFTPSYFGTPSNAIATHSIPSAQRLRINPSSLVTLLQLFQRECEIAENIVSSDPTVRDSAKELRQKCKHHEGRPHPRGADMIRRRARYTLRGWRHGMEAYVEAVARLYRSARRTAKAF